MTSDELKWSEWMVEAQKGDDVSYRLLLDALGKAIENYLRSRFGPLDFLEDMVQESLLAIHQARHTYDAGRPFRPWMFAIVRHKAIDMLRKVNARPDQGNRKVTDHEPQSLSDSLTTNDSAEALLEGAQVLHGIKPQSHQALLLTKVEGLSVREAAEKLGVSEVAMKVRVHRALRELRSQLKLQ